MIIFANQRTWETRLCFANQTYLRDVFMFCQPDVLERCVYVLPTRRTWETRLCFANQTYLRDAFMFCQPDVLERRVYVLPTRRTWETRLCFANQTYLRDVFMFCRLSKLIMRNSTYFLMMNVDNKGCRWKARRAGPSQQVRSGPIKRFMYFYYRSAC